MQAHHIRLDFLIFNGENPTSWIFRCEQYQQLATLYETDMLSLAIEHLNGNTVPWYN